MTIIANSIYDAVLKFLINEPAPFIESLPHDSIIVQKEQSKQYIDA